VDERLRLISVIVQKAERWLISENKPIPDQLVQAKQQLSKLRETEAKKNQKNSTSLSNDDVLFANTFLEHFTTSAFSNEMQALQEQEGANMTGEDLATLAESIRSFGLGIPKCERHLFQQSSNS